MAGSDLINWTNPITGMLPAILGGESESDIDNTENTTSTSSTNTTGTTEQTSTGTTGQTSTGTTGQTSAGTSNQTSTGTTTQTTNADITALQDIFARQSAGITPEMLTAIFEQGAKQVPGLQTAYGNAVGARASDNSPLATSIRDLQGNLTNQAAVLNNQLLKDSSITAQAIAELTKTITGDTSNTTTGANTNTATGTNTNTTTGTSSNTTTGTTNQSTDTENTTDTTSTQGIDQSNTVNTDVLKVLTGLGIGGSVLDSVLGGNGTTGGLIDIFKNITGVVPGALKDLFGGGSNLDLTGTWDGLFGAGSLARDLEEFGINWEGNFDDLLGGAADGFNFDLGSIDWSGDVADYLTFGWADGGEITPSGNTGTLQMAPEARKQMLQKAMVLQQLLKDPKGRKLLAAKAAQNKNKYQSYGADDWRDATKQYAKDNKLEMPQYNFLDTALGLGADNPQPFQDSLDQTNKITAGFLSSLPPGAQRQYMITMKDDLAGNNFNQFMDRVMPMIPGAVAGLGAGGALGLLSPGTASAAGFGAAGAAGGFAGSGAMANIGNMFLRQLLSKGINTGMGAITANADGGRIHRPGDPVIGTKGPVRKESGSGGLSDEAIVEALKKPTIPRATAGAASAARRDNGLSFQTNKMLREIDNYAEGGEIEGTLLDEMADPEGTQDTITGQLSVGEYVIPRDVVDELGVDFFDQLKERYHTPVAMQEAMGVGGVSQ